MIIRFPEARSRKFSSLQEGLDPVFRAVIKENDESNSGDVDGPAGDWVW